jgi:hypothetical protein
MIPEPGMENAPVTESETISTIKPTTLRMQYPPILKNILIIAPGS